MKIYFLLFFVCFGKEIRKSRNLALEEPELEDDNKYLQFLDPNNLDLESVKMDTTRLGFLQHNQKYATQLIAKLQSMKFLVNKRLEEMA